MFLFEYNISGELRKTCYLFLCSFEFLEQEYFPGKLETNSLYKMIENTRAFYFSEL